MENNAIFYYYYYFIIVVIIIIIIGIQCTYTKTFLPFKNTIKKFHKISAHQKAKSNSPTTTTRKKKR